MFGLLVYGLLVSLCARLVDCFTWLLVCYLPDWSLALFFIVYLFVLLFFLCAVIISAKCFALPVTAYFWYTCLSMYVCLGSPLSLYLTPSPSSSLSSSLSISHPTLSLSLSLSLTLPPSHSFSLPLCSVPLLNFLFVCSLCLFALFVFVIVFFSCSFFFWILNTQHTRFKCMLFCIRYVYFSRLVPLWARAEC